MTKAIPTIQKFMTTAPHSIGPDQPLVKAREMLHAHDIRHLPVLSGGRLVGMLTDRDLSLIESMAGVDAKTATVEEAMTSSVYAVPPETPLDEVVATMGSRKYGSAVVMQNAKVVGIFTTVDLCHAFTELLQTRLVH